MTKKEIEKELSKLIDKINELQKQSNVISIHTKKAQDKIHRMEKRIIKLSNM